MRRRVWSVVAGLGLAGGCGSPPRPAPAPAPPPAPPIPEPAPAPAVSAAAEAPAPPPDLCDAVPEGMACIPGGPFVRGVDQDDHRCPQGGNLPTSAATPAMTIEVDTFYLDLTEVTVAAWATCHEAGACAKARPFYPDFDSPEQPKVGVSWFDAKTYCAWAGKRLPTEAEWEKAARGPDGEVTPFGDVPITCDNAVIMDRTGRSCGTRNRAHKPSTGRVLPVRSRPAGRYGLFDMVGNAEEWVADWWTPSWEACGEACRGPNPKGPCGGAEDCPGHRWRSVRGGSWYWTADHATGYHRRRHFPPNQFPDYHHFGFRCAMDAVVAEG